MIRFGKKSKILAAVLAAGIILSMQGMTAFAGSTGVGAAKPAQTGPGVAAQNDSQPGQAGGAAVRICRRAFARVSPAANTPARLVLQSSPARM